MAKKSNLYTRTGDHGTTSLASGRRVPKTNTRLEAYGTLDELTSLLGLLIAKLPQSTDRDYLLTIQGQLFAIGACLADDTWGLPPGDTLEAVPKASGSAVSPEALRELELTIDELSQEQGGGWRGFILPGGTETAALCHVCRTVCRRMERRIYAIEGMENLPQDLYATAYAPMLAYVNRLSDYLFALAKKLNAIAGVEEKTWCKPSRADI